MSEETMTLEETSQFLGVSTSVVKRFIREKLLQSKEAEDGSVILLKANVENYKKIYDRLQG